MKPNECPSCKSPLEEYYYFKKIKKENSSIKEYSFNKYILLRKDKKRANIYVNKEKFIQCRRLILNIPISEINVFDDIDSLEEAKKKLYYLRKEKKIKEKKLRLKLSDEFWGHCSNLSAWVNNNYNSRILHYNLSFSLLKRLYKIGDQKAISVYLEEIIDRLNSKSKTVANFLLANNLWDFTIKELETILIESNNLFAHKGIEGIINIKQKGYLNKPFKIPRLFKLKGELAILDTSYGFVFQKIVKSVKLLIKPEKDMRVFAHRRLGVYINNNLERKGLVSLLEDINQNINKFPKTEITSRRNKIFSIN
jgi:hypothetical protein